tara:strand:- start:2394 stop:2996 length:603 start_codon:yes stop_codon:yes gene_type:complete
MRKIAHRGIKEYENKMERFEEALEKSDGIEIDVRYNTKRELVLCHDRERRNEEDNDKLEKIRSCRFEKGKKVIIDIKAFGITEAKEIARDVHECLKEVATKDWKLCSFNEYCVFELTELAKRAKYRVGVIATGLSIGMYTHLDIDFVSLDYNVITKEVVEMFHANGIKVYSWTVNDIEMQHALEYEYKVDYIIEDLKKFI